MAAGEVPTPLEGQRQRALEEKGRRVQDVLLPAQHHSRQSANHGDTSIFTLSPHDFFSHLPTA